MEKFLEYFNNLQFAYKFVSIIIMGLLLVSIVLFVFILLARFIKNRREKRFNAHCERFEDYLASLLFNHNHDRGDVSYRSMISKLKLELKHPLKRKAFKKTIFALHTSILGASAKYLEYVYFDVGLHNFAIQKILKGAWYEKAAAFRELSEFYVVSKVEYIRVYTDDQNKELRNEAQFACVYLLGVKGLDFVPRLKNIISEWQQLSILEQLKKVRREDIPTFIPWLQSTNFSVRVFALKLVTYFNQLEIIEHIPYLITDESDKVKIEMFYCLEALQIDDYNELIKNHYPGFSFDVKLAAIKTLAEIGLKDDQYFLFEQAALEDYDIVLQASYALKRLGFNEELQMFKAPENPFNRRIIQHALDERI